MKKKTFISLVIILIVIMIIQIIVFNIKEKKQNESTIDYNENSVTNNDINTSKIYPINTYKVFDIYKGPITIPDFEGIIYKMIFENIPSINTKYANMTQQAFNQEYSKSTSDINQMYIYSADNLYLITQQIKNVYKDSTPVFDYAEIDDKSIKNENSYCSFNINICFVNNQTISLKMYLSNTNSSASTEKPVIVEDNSSIQKLYETANEGFNKANAIEIIENIIDNMEQIKTDTRGYSVNKEMQYYDLHKDEINKLGIYSQDDFVEFVGEVKNISWNDDDSITGYSIDLSQITEDINYYTVDLYINYGNIERVALKMSVSKQINIEPQIKIK